jgi:hypothetical protein
MISLVRFLCTQLKCDADELHTNIRDHRRRVLGLLRKTPLYIAVSEYSEHGEVVASGFVVGCGQTATTTKTPAGYTETPFCGLTTGPAKNLFARGGQEAITVAQYYSIVTGESLQYPNLPCIVERRGVFGGELYTPLEIVKVDGAKK